MQDGGFVEVAESRQVILPHQDVGVTERRQLLTPFQRILQLLKNRDFINQIQSIKSHVINDVICIHGRVCVHK